MRIAIFSDIHGNPFATRAILDAIAADGLFDAVIMAGDVCAGGSDPAGCVDMLRAARVQAVYGNADAFTFAPTPEPPHEIYRARWPQTLAGGQWVREQIGAARLDWLRRLPFALRFSPTPNAAEDLLVVHANPKDAFDFILPPEADQLRLQGEVFQADDDPALAGMFAGVQAAVMAYGHFHYTSERNLFGIRLVNVAPASFSAVDPDRRARYTIFTWDKTWEIERKFVEYDYRQEGKALLASDMPNREARARFFPPSGAAAEPLTV